MRAIFETEEYGRIEVYRDGPSSYSGSAYFYKPSFRAPSCSKVYPEGLFTNSDGVSFKVTWSADGKTAWLDVLLTKRIGPSHTQG